MMREVLVLGSTGTIGRSVVTELVKAGAKVHTPGRDFTWHPVKPWGLVCCFGTYGPCGRLEEVEQSEIYQSLFTNVYAQIIQVREFIRLLEGRPGRIVLMSGGGVGSGNFPRDRTSYVAAKHAIVGFVEAMSQELGQNVLINAVAPGPVRSKMTAGETRYDWVDPFVSARLITSLIMNDNVQVTGKLWSALKRQPFSLRTRALTGLTNPLQESNIEV